MNSEFVKKISEYIIKSCELRIHNQIFYRERCNICNEMYVKKENNKHFCKINKNILRTYE